jgi:hypothetical protein
MPEHARLEPHMDADGLRYFQESLKRSRCYLEYGSGGSTAHAAKIAQIPTIISIESDKLWIEKVRKTVGIVSSKLYLEHCDIGEVGDWGNPKTKDKVDDYWKYAAMPWGMARSLNVVPDTVLVDGRFRVSCFLFSLVSARVGTTILFDDYLDRPEYYVVERFCQLHEKSGRMAVFVVAKSFSIPEICEKIAQYSVLPNS